MFFMIDITNGRKDLNFNQMIICDGCGQYGRYMVYMTYTVLSLFFIPCFKWNRQYFVQSTCCGRTYRLAPEIGRRIERGEELEIKAEDLEPVYDRWQQNQRKSCQNCGFTTNEDFDFCPKCGKKF